MDNYTPAGARKLSLILIAGGAAALGLNFYFLSSSRTYYAKLAVLGPTALIVGIAFLIHPALARKARPGETGRVVAQVGTVVAGILVGFGYLWYLSR